MKKLISNVVCFGAFSMLVFIFGCSNTTNNPVTPTTITVSGKALDAYGNGVNSATVLIGTQTTLTGGDGSFTINNVTKPYDIYVMSSSAGVFGVKGLTLTNPYIPCGVTGNTSAALNVVIPTVPNGSRATVIFQDTLTGKISGFAQIPASSFSAVINLGGILGQSVAGKVYVIECNLSSGVVTGYTGYAEQPASFTIGSLPTITFASLNGGLGNSTVSGTVTSSGGTGLSATLFINFGSKNNVVHRGGFIQRIAISGNTGTFTFNVPTGTTTAAQLNVLASDTLPSYAQRMKTLSAGTSGAFITVDSVSVLQNPINLATGVDTTTSFTCSNGGGTGIHVFKITPNGNGKYFEIITTGTSVTIPNLANYAGGIYILGSGNTYSWVVGKTMDISSVDDYSSQFFDLNPSVVATTVSTQNTFTAR